MSFIEDGIEPPAHRWRCARCGHEVETPGAWGAYAVPRCHECETRVELYPNGPKISAPLPMTRIGEAA